MPSASIQRLKEFLVKDLLKWCIPTILALSPETSLAQAGDIVPPPGAVMWQYECKIGDCNAKCTLNGTELFSAGSLFGLVVMQLPERGYWFRIDAGQSSVDYVQMMRTEQMTCTVIGTSTVRITEGAKSDTAKLEAPKPAQPRNP